MHGYLKRQHLAFKHFMVQIGSIKSEGSECFDISVLSIILFDYQ